MPAQVLTDLAAQVTDTRGTLASATTLINGFAARMQTAIDAAIAGGASAQDLAPVQAEVDGLKTDTVALATAVAANQ